MADKVGQDWKNPASGTTARSVTGKPRLRFAETGQNLRHQVRDIILTNGAANRSSVDASLSTGRCSNDESQTRWAIKLGTIWQILIKKINRRSSKKKKDTGVNLPNCVSRQLNQPGRYSQRYREEPTLVYHQDTHRHRSQQALPPIRPRLSHFSGTPGKRLLA